MIDTDKHNFIAWSIDNITALPVRSHMTTENLPRETTRLFSWFFTSDQSRYELAEVIRLTHCTKDDVQNWVRRGMIAPDETTPGRRIYSARTVAELVIAASLRFNGMTANHALMTAKVVSLKVLQWFAERELDGDELPEFSRDFTDHFAAFYFSDIYPLGHQEKSPAEPGVEKLPGILYVEIQPLRNLEVVFRESPAVTVVQIHRQWINLAREAFSLKSRPTKRLSARK